MRKPNGFATAVFVALTFFAGPASSAPSAVGFAGTPCSGVASSPATLPSVTLTAPPGTLSSPVYVTDGDGSNRLFVVERPGRVRIYKNGALLATPFLDITASDCDDGTLTLPILEHPSCGRGNHCPGAATPRGQMANFPRPDFWSAVACWGSRWNA